MIQVEKLDSSSNFIIYLIDSARRVFLRMHTTLQLIKVTTYHHVFDQPDWMAQPPTQNYLHAGSQACLVHPLLFSPNWNGPTRLPPLPGPNCWPSCVTCRRTEYCRQTCELFSLTQAVLELAVWVKTRLAGQARSRQHRLGGFPTI